MSACEICQGPWDDLWHQCLPEIRPERCGGPVLHDDLDLPQWRPHNAHSAKSDAVSTDVSIKRHCVVCGASAGVHLTIAPACDAHSSPAALEQELAWERDRRKSAETVLAGVVAETAPLDAELARLRAALARWADASEAEAGRGLPTGERDRRIREADAARDDLMKLARSLAAAP